MKITVYKIMTGKIVKILTGPADIIINCLGTDEQYIEGAYALTGSIINNAFVEKEYLFPQYPAENINDVLEYQSVSIEAMQYALQNIGIEGSQVVDALIEHYKILRKRSYPEIELFVDAHVKMSSSNSVMQTEGSAQLDKYYQDCLAVKIKYPKVKE